MSKFLTNIEKEWDSVVDFPIESKPERLAYLEDFKQKGLPTRRDEDWKYTNIGFLNKINFSSGNGSKINSELISGIIISDLDVHLVVLVNGKFSEDLSQFESNENLKIIPFSKLKKDNHRRFKENFGKMTEGGHRFENLNRALFSDGLFVELGGNYKAEKTIHILNIANCKDSPVIINHRNLIVAGECSNVKIINSYYSIGAFESIFNTSSEINLDNSANLTYYNLQNDDQDLSHIFNTTRSQLAKNSIFSDFTFSLGGKFIRNELSCRLIGEQSLANLYGLYLADQNSLVDNHTFVAHEVPNSTSNEFYKGIIDDRAKGIFNGRVLVKKDAQKTNATQQNRNIVLSDKAQINTKPELEIYADDVKCSHGATTGVIDQDALFYMRQRGIPLAKARSLLMFTFCYETIEKIDIEQIKEYLTKIIKKRLNI